MARGSKPGARSSESDGGSEQALRDAVAHESAEVLRHQLEAERVASVKMRRPDMILSFFLAGVGAGVGWAGASGWFGKRSRPKRRRR